MQYKFFMFHFAFDLYLEIAKRYKIRNKKLAKIAQGGEGEKSTGGGRKCFARYARKFYVLRTFYRASRDFCTYI